MPTVIYAITHSGNGKVYVGASRRHTQRWRAHILDLRKGQHHSPHLQRSFARDGEDVFSFSILEIVADASQRHIREQHWIDVLHAADTSKGFNICPIAGTCEYTKQSPETIARRAEKLRGQKRTRTPEWTEKIADARRGKPMRAETKAKISAANTGKKRSPETCRKISEGQRGKTRGPISPEHKERLRIANTGRSGVPWTADMREAASLARKGKKRKPFTEETRRRMSAAATAARLRQRENGTLVLPPSRKGSVQTEATKTKRAMTWAAKRAVA